MGRLFVILPVCLALCGQSIIQDAVPIDSPDEVAVTPIGEKGPTPLEKILQENPVRFLEMTLEKYDKEVQSYTFTFRKQERIAGKLQEPETIKVYFREKPFSVFFDWTEGARLAKRCLYVEGENNGKLRVRPNLPFVDKLIWNKDVEGTEAKRSGRYTINHFGLKLATERTVKSMRAAEKRGTLHVRYLGQFKVPELHDRLCYKFVRTPYDPVEEEGLNELVLYIDHENWLQVGSILRDAQGEIIAEYYFRDLEINPTISEEIFAGKKL